MGEKDKKSQEEDTEDQGKRLVEDEDDTEGQRRRLAADESEDDTEDHGGRKH